MRSLLLAALCLCSVFAQPLPQLPLDLISLPSGFSIALYSQDTVPSARQITLSTASNPTNPSAVIVYVGSNASPGQVTALVDAEGNGTVVLVPVLTNLNAPNGVTYHDGYLYVAEITKVTRYANPDQYALAGQPFPAGDTIISTLLVQDDHSVHFIRVGPDGLLYVPQGSPSNTGPCNVYGNVTQCAIMRAQLDGSDLQTYATGIRNSVGFDWDQYDNLWATSNGRDNLDPDHDNRPDDPLNFIPAGTADGQLDFGFPYCHWQGLGNPLDRNPGPGIVVLDDVNTPVGVVGNNSFTSYCDDPSNNQPPAQALGPHVAALGARFYQGSVFPSQFNQSLFIAQHGSWDRDQKIGYRVMNAQVDSNGTVVQYNIFAQGWLQGANTTNASVWGRPVDVQPLPDGSLLVSDDGASAVYRITYNPTIQATSIEG